MSYYPTYQVRVMSAGSPICIESFTNYEEAVDKAEALYNVECAYSFGVPSDDYTVYEFNSLEGERIVWMNGRKLEHQTR